MYVPQLLPLLAARRDFFFERFLVAFFFIFADCSTLSVPGCDPGPANVAACSCGSGKSAIATPNASPLSHIFLVAISILPAGHRAAELIFTRRRSNNSLAPLLCRSR